jgi:hypothetical protein
VHARIAAWFRRWFPESWLILLAAVLLIFREPFDLALPLFIGWSAAEYRMHGLWRMLVRSALFWSIIRSGMIAVGFTRLDPYPAGVSLVPVAVDLAPKRTAAVANRAYPARANGLASLFCRQPVV